MKFLRDSPGLGVRMQILVLAVVPLLTIALVIGGYMVHARLADARESLDERGRIVAANLAMAAEFGLLTRDLVQLRGLCDSALRQPDVVSASVLGADGHLLAQSGGSTHTRDTGGRFRAPMGTTGVQVADFEGETAKDRPPRPLGWAEVRLSLEGTLARQHRIMVTSLLIIGGGLLLSVFAALRIGTRISRPLMELSEAVTQYREGDLSVRIETDAGGEIGELSRGFNRMAKALERSQSLLREQVSSTTEELQRTIEVLSTKNAQLEAARKEALAAGQEKYEFLARMSHEIRTPLNAVVGFSRLLRDDTGGQGTREYTQTIDLAANQLLCVIDGILNFTRLESGNLELERLPFDPRTCLEDVVAMLSPAAHDKGLELALVLHRDIPETLLGDPNRIAQVLMNLLNNAIKFTAVGHVFVEAGYASDETGKGTVRVMVNDTGIGLSPNERKRLFQPFSQADSAVTRRYGGTGLGLVICERLVRLMGGSIGVDSEPSKGSRFFFTIPCGPAPVPIPKLDAGPLAGRRVLVYDRQPIQLRALRTALLGWSMAVFNTGRSDRIPTMLKTVADTEQPFELLILGLDSRESRPQEFEQLMARIRPHYDGPTLVLVGAERWELPPGQRQERGGLDWTTKPVRRTLLYRCLCQLTGQEAVQDAARTAARAWPDLTGLRVLTVEDNAFNRLLLRRLLELRGVDIQEACDGAEAVAKTRNAAFDLIFMDIHMPGMDGMETARRIRAQAADAPCPPIVALSADVFARDRPMEQNPVFDGFLLKPVNDAALDDTICRTLRPAGNGVRKPPTGIIAIPEDTDTPVRLPSDLDTRLKREVEALCGRLNSAMGLGDRDAIRGLAHELKGLCGYFGAQSLTSVVRELEGAALEESLAELQERLRTVRRLNGVLSG